MPIPQEGALESCRRIEAMLREVQQLALVPRTETLAECVTQLGMIAASLETLHGRMTDEAVAPQSNPAIRLKLEQIQRASRKLKSQFDHGSNYCMGLLQVRLGIGYSEQGQPWLVPNKNTSSFEG